MSEPNRTSRNPGSRRAQRPFSKGWRAEADVPTGSMADIAFLLIIFFMLTVVFSATKGMEVAMSKDKPPDIAVTPEESIYIRVLPGGALEVDRRPMALQDLLAYVVPKLRVNRTKPVILHSHPDAAYKEMIRVYDELLASERKTGYRITTIAIPTEREIQEYGRLLGRNPFDGPGG